MQLVGKYLVVVFVSLFFVVCVNEFSLVKIIFYINDVYWLFGFFFFEVVEVDGWIFFFGVFGIVFGIVDFVLGGIEGEVC